MFSEKKQLNYKIIKWVKTLHRCIKDLANGNFEYEKPIISLSVNRIDLEVSKDSVGKGNFGIQELSGKKVKGIIYSSNSRMICLVTQFEGNTIDIPFEFNTTGLEGGEVQKGEFHIISSAGEYVLPFEVRVSVVFETSSIGEVKNLFHFANLAQTNWEEAYRVFYSKKFANIFEKKEREYKGLYESFSSGIKDEQNLESFLVAVRKKARVRFQIEELKTNYIFDNLEENVSEKIEITKDNWGYLRLEVKTDAPFIKIQKNVIKTSDFVGKSCIFEYIIEVDKLHEGNNFANITFSSAYHSITCSICVKQQLKDIVIQKAIQKNIEKKQNMKGLLKRYILFRMKSISASTWAKDTLTYLERLHNLEDDNQWYELFQAQTRIVNQQLEDARWLLGRYAEKNEKKENNPEQYGYYLYLTTLCNPDRNYINEVTVQVQSLYQRNKNSWRLLWILLYLDEELENSRSKKLQAIEQQIDRGCRSPVLYIEAYYAMLQDPFLISNLGKSILKIIWWIIKQEALNQEMANQIFHLASREKKFNPLLYKVLNVACEKYGSKENVGILCGYLIKNDKYQKRYFKWYAKAVAYDLRITRLYEYYMMTVGDSQDIEIPQMVLMYFRYNSQLDYRRKAFLYVYILRHQLEYEEIYRNYRPLIERFVIDQILEEHFDVNLAYLYKNILTEGMLTPELAKPLSHLLFMQQIKCKNANMKQVIVSHPELAKEQVIPLIDGKAYISIFTDACEILFQDSKGRRYGKDVAFTLAGLMPKESLYQRCLSLYPLSVELGLYYFEQKKTFRVEEANNLNILFFIEKSTFVKEKLKRDIRTEIIQFYYENNGEYKDDVEEFFLGINYHQLEISERAKVIEILILNRQYKPAFEKICQYGVDRISIKLLLRLCCNFIMQEQEGDGEQIESELLTQLAYVCVTKGKYNETVLEYLVEHFHGTLAQMIEIWELAEQFNTETYELSERIIVQMLFTKDYSSKVDKIFSDYYHKGARRDVKNAYFSYYSYEYFVHQRLLSNKFVLCLTKEYLRKEEQNEVCKLALFKALSEKQLDEKEMEIVKELMKEYMEKNMYFKFYQNFPMSIINRYQLNDKLFIEYNTDPKNKVEIHYILSSQSNANDSFVTEDMEHMYEGIFVKAITMFFGENLQYYMNEQSEKEDKITESISISKSDLPVEQKESKYDLLNEIILSETLQDEHTMIHMMERFMERDYIAKKVFHIR